MKNILKYCVPYKDMFNYYNLITKIDMNYKLLFNNKEKCFIVINTAKNNQICLKTNSLSFNIIEYLQSTRIEQSNLLFKNIDNYNYNLTNKNIKNLKDNVTLKSVELINYSRRTSNISKGDINKIIEG